MNYEIYNFPITKIINDEIVTNSTSLQRAEFKYDS